MRVALYLPTLGGGGAERVAVAHANDLVERGHEVDVVLAGQGGQLSKLLSPKARIVELKAHRTIAALQPLIRYLRDRKPDALHALMWPGTVIAILAHRLARSRARLTVSDHTHYSQHFAQSGNRRELRGFRWTTRVFYSLADARIACSEASADDLAQLSGIPRGRFHVIHSPISPPPKMPKTNADLWGRAGRRILNVGSLNPVKNQALLICAFARLQDEGAALVILGEGPERTRLQELASELGVAERVRMPGYVADPWPWLASAHLFALTSNYEGSPVALAEAMYAGLKIVSTDCISGPRELLDGGRLGGLVPCNDEAGLAGAMAAALSGYADPSAVRARALELAGPNSIARYADVVTGIDP